MTPGLRPVSVFDAFVALVPDPTPVDEVFDPYAVVVPYSNRYVVERPFGFTFPFSFAPVDPTELAAVVVTLGAAAVTKVASAP